MLESKSAQQTPQNEAIGGPVGKLVTMIFSLKPTHLLMIFVVIVVIGFALAYDEFMMGKIHSITEALAR